MDDVIRNVLPKYRQSLISITDAEYETDVGRIQRAFSTDSKVQREKLVAALRETAFVRAVDAGDGSKWHSNPGNVYLATDRMKESFAGINQVFLVDDSYKCLRGEDVRELLEACGATRHLQTVQSLRPLLMFNSENCDSGQGASACHGQSRSRIGHSEDSIVCFTCVIFSKLRTAPGPIPETIKGDQDS